MLPSTVERFLSDCGHLAVSSQLKTANGPIKTSVDVAHVDAEGECVGSMCSLPLAKAWTKFR